ncbi:hypothetical protein HHK36_025033 [Tetracentron sinense]|uniref:Uncharacterized protein n=1 Tax=Tetracentron sinense TaxID=13715 RepID=A0A834YP87_TETSI|nr:hypothetical protein HHK36_025033 [Tetracentron sinense]
MSYKQQRNSWDTTNDYHEYVSKVARMPSMYPNPQPHYPTLFFKNKIVQEEQETRKVHFPEAGEVTQVIEYEQTTESVNDGNSKVEESVNSESNDFIQQQQNNLSLDESEEDGARDYFQCPYCYVDIEVPVLCTHLQEEHCFDAKNAVCPVCAANLGKDMIGHFTVQHSHFLKRRKKSQRSSLWTDNSGMLGKELRELSSFLGVTSTNGRGSTPDSAPDPVLSPFLCGVAIPDTKCNQDASSRNDSSTISYTESPKPSTSVEALDQDYEERSLRADFFQQLILSTIF